MARSPVDLGLGSHGPEVRALQRALRRLGYTIALSERRAETFGPTTEQAVSDFQKAADLPVIGSVDPRTAGAIDGKVAALPIPSTFVVHGTVRGADGKLLAGARVQAADIDLRSEQILGETRTTPDGAYSLSFNRSAFAAAEADGPDLIIRALAPSVPAREPTTTSVVARFAVAPEVVLATSAIVFNAAADVTIDLIVPGAAVVGLSEYERLGAELQPLLHGIAAQDLTASDVQFLANEIDYEPEWISFYALAWRYSSLSGVTASPSAVGAPGAAGGAPPEAYYGLFREGMPTDLAALLRRDTADLRRALELALQDNIVPATLRAQLEPVLQRLLYPAIQTAFKTPANPAVATIGALTATAIPVRANQETFLAAYLNHRGPAEDFWTTLQLRPEFPAPVVEDLQYAFWLGALARDHFPLVTALQTMRKQGTLKTAMDLATKDEAWWRSQVAAPIGVPADVPGATPEDKTTNYVKTLMRTLEAAFPTTVIAMRLGGEEVPLKADLARFFANSPEFDLRSDHPDVYVDAHPQSLAGVTDGLRLRKRLKGIQRIFKLTPHYDEMRVLLGDGHDSAQRVARIDKDAFVQSYGQALGGGTRAAEIHARALQVAAAALLVFSKFSPSVNRVDTRVTPRLL